MISSTAMEKKQAADQAATSPCTFSFHKKIPMTDTKKNMPKFSPIITRKPAAPCQRSDLTISSARAHPNHCTTSVAAADADDNSVERRDDDLGIPVTNDPSARPPPDPPGLSRTSCQSVIAPLCGPATATSPTSSHPHRHEPFTNGLLEAIALSVTGNDVGTVPLQVVAAPVGRLSRCDSTVNASYQRSNTFRIFPRALVNLDTVASVRPNLFGKEVSVTCRPCRCTKSHCLTLYCSCFKGGVVCDPSLCKCKSCVNVSDDQTGQRAQKIAVTLNRYNRSDETFALYQPKTRTASTKTEQSCGCKKSRCLLKFCCCMAQGALCTPQCSCVNCSNTTKTNLSQANPS